MKLTAVNNRQIRQNRQSNTTNNNQYNRNLNFRGFTDTLIRAWEIIDSNRGIQFTVEDMCGTNIPRTTSGAMSGYEYTGKINWPYFWQEGIREFLTGPTMTCAPIAILALITKMSGKTASTHKENIVNLSYLASLLKEKEGVNEESFIASFARDTVKDALIKTINPDSKATLSAVEGADFEADVDALTELILKYTKQTKTKEDQMGAKGILNGIKGLFNKETRGLNKKQKAEAKNTLAKAQKRFEEIIKRRKESFVDTNFKLAKYSISNTETGTTSFESYVKYISAYIDDYIRENKDEKGFINLATDTITKFKDSWTAKRLGVVGALIFGTGIIMSFIPKLYTLASGGINPGGKAIYDEAAKREGK